METRRLGRLGHQSSVLIYGAAALSEVAQDVADASVAEALAGGINHFDVAASYGDAEERLGVALAGRRSDIFLASKTGDRDAEAAWASINRSLELLQTDHLDLIQCHGVHELDELDRITGKGGALESLVRARDEGMVKGLGITGHTHAAPSVHAEALRRFDFDTVLTPLNHRLWRQPGYAEDYEALLELVRAADVGLMTIKTIARRNYPGERTHSTWYEPFTDQRLITAAVAWVLNGHAEVTGIATAGDTTLLGQLIAAEREREQLSVAKAEGVLSELPASEYKSVFDADQPI